MAAKPLAGYSAHAPFPHSELQIALGGRYDPAIDLPGKCDDGRLIGGRREKFRARAKRARLFPLAAPFDESVEPLGNVGRLSDLAECADLYCIDPLKLPMPSKP